ncbi:transcriptional regulator [Actinocatenispora thailandica]|uniref:Transcriptional regulator n=1 Tax=Actinocatenispora thailandica TaxID=227318 RepID=A0A7R7HY27_9ACTN|nr:helix-turn-helix transcriptional regulator [Actinocatenispora thailandica]BCJ36862.1 transcriptional regulator [Actinocatenispora thailandica]
MTATSPVIKAWELGIRLREYRQQAGLTATETAKNIGVTQGHVSAVEAGRPKLTADRLAQLCTLYDIGSDERVELESLRLGANEKAWWHEYGGIFSAELQKFFGLEAGAECVRSYHSELIYGLFQTEEYTRALIAGGTPHVRLTEVERRVQARMARRNRLAGTDPLQISCLLAESTLRQNIGGRDVMAAQLDHLVMLSSQPNIQLRVLPFSLGVHPSIGAPYQVLSFESPRLHDIVWQEILTSTAIVDSRDDVADYVLTYHMTERLALSEDESITFIQDIRKEV